MPHTDLKQDRLVTLAWTWLRCGVRIRSTFQARVISWFYVLAITLAFQVKAIDNDYLNSFQYSSQLYEIEMMGIRYYNNGEYEESFKKLRLSAREGLKNSQHYLGVMYLKGQSVPQSIELGMGWLGVANEIEVESWIQLYSELYDKLSGEQKQLIDIKVSELISLYGLEVQNITCVSKGSLSSRRVRLRCQKNEDRGLWVKH